MEVKKINVGVCAKFSANGGMIPTEIIWTNGKRYKIDRVTGIARAPRLVSHALPVRYSCVVGGTVKELYFEPQAEVWFVETFV